jgi:hypothetical protein
MIPRGPQARSNAFNTRSRSRFDARAVGKSFGYVSVTNWNAAAWHSVWSMEFTTPNNARLALLENLLIAFRSPLVTSFPLGILILRYLPPFAYVTDGTSTTGGGFCTDDKGTVRPGPAVQALAPGPGPTSPPLNQSLI